MISLFETRGGTTLAHRCEVCNEELDPQSLLPTCLDCAGVEGGEDE